MKPLQVAQGTVAVLLIWFAIAGIPAKRQPDLSPPPANTPALASKAKAVAYALAGASPVDRAVWAEVWEKSSKAVLREAKPGEPVFTDSRGLRAYTVMALEIAWHRIQGIEPGRYPRLREAVEDFFADPAVLGRDDVTLDDAGRQRYSDACTTLAWCGMNRG